MKDVVVVFARAPRLGTVKRRLADGIGVRAALQFHVGTLFRLLRQLNADRRFRVVVATTPDRMTFRLPINISRIGQGGGDIGARMARACGLFRKGNVAVVGSDIPDITANDIAAAFQALGRADAAFGPAADGGYWLVALSPRRPAAPFAGVRWSTRHALADTLINFKRHKVAKLRVLRDVDTPEDWHDWRDRSRYRHTTPAIGGRSDG